MQLLDHRQLAKRVLVHYSPLSTTHPRTVYGIMHLILDPVALILILKLLSGKNYPSFPTRRDRRWHVREREFFTLRADRISSRASATRADLESTGNHEEPCCSTHRGASNGARRGKDGPVGPCLASATRVKRSFSALKKPGRYLPEWLLLVISETSMSALRGRLARTAHYARTVSRPVVTDTCAVSAV